MRIEQEFFGVTAEPKRDYQRLGRQSARVLEALMCGQWITLREISDWTHDPEASCSARIRGLRALGHPIERRYVKNGLHQYRLLLPAQRELF